MDDEAAVTDQETPKPKAKPLKWMGSSRKDLKAFPDEIRKPMGYALYLAQINLKALNAKPLRRFGGASTLEVVEDHDGSTYRAVYTVKFQNIVYVLHAFQKKSMKGTATPKHDIDLMKKRLQAATEQYAKEQRGKKP